jgi:hypothetical protein
MLVQLTADQIAKHWGIIRNAVIECAPPLSKVTENSLNRILELLLMGNMHCWLYFIEEKAVAVVVTTFYHDFPTGSQDLLIYALWGKGGLPNDAYQNGYVTLMRFALAHNCNKMYAFTQVPMLVKLAKQFGAELQYYVGLPIKEV